MVQYHFIKMEITNHLYYLKLKHVYENDNVFSSSHNHRHSSLVTIEGQKNKEDFLPIILEELKTNPQWFDIISISYIIPVPTIAPEISGKFDELCEYYIKYLTKYIRKLKINKIDEYRHRLW